MGHANLKNLDVLMIKRIYAKGKVTLRDLVQTAILQGESLQASEGPYDDAGMLCYGFEHCILFHLKNKTGTHRLR